MSEHEIDLAERFPDLRPIGKVPSLFTLNGIGIAVYGRRDFDELTCTYVKTRCLCCIFVPALAVDAYRVADAPNGGWYFIGKEPLSGLAKAWNVLVLASILLLVGAIYWRGHTSSPEYLARQKLDQAEALAADGDAVGAAQLFQQAAAGGTKYAPTAAARMQTILSELAKDEAKAEQSIRVLQWSAGLAQSGKWPGGKEALLKEGEGLVGRLEKSKPREALAALDALQPLGAGEETHLPLRIRLLESLVRRDPADPEAASQLAVLYEQAEQMDKLEPLLAPHAARLAALEGARILGQIYTSQGKFDEANALLVPYTEDRLKAFHAAEKAWESGWQASQQRVLNDLNAGKGPPSFYRDYEAADDAGKQQIVDEYLQSKLVNDPQMKTLQQRLAEASSIVPVAFDLGMVQLQRGQSMIDPAARKAELERAEKTFLAIQGAASGSEQYQLQLGQVYYWLGRNEEGRALFDQALAAQNRSSESLIEVAHLLRNVGATGEARALTEEAYESSATEEQRFSAARIRALLNLDTDDEIAWLKRSDPNAADVRATLEKALGYKASVEGRSEEAAAHFKKSIEIYNQQPESATTLNNSAVAWLALHGVTGDPADFRKAAERLERAITLSPKDSILLSNAAELVLADAATEIIGDAIDLPRLKLRGNISLLAYLYQDEQGRQAYVEKLREHPRLKTALGYFEKLLVIAPKNPGAYQSLFSIYAFCRDEEALAELARRIEEAGPDMDDQIRQARAYQAGERDAELIPAVRTRIAELEKAAGAAQQGGQETTRAAACASLATQMMQGDVVGIPGDAERVVELAGQAHQAAPSGQTESVLISALLFRAHKRLIEKSPEYRSTEARTRRSTSHGYLLASACRQTSEQSELAAADADIQEALAMLRDRKSRLDVDDPWLWAMLAAAHPDEAAEVALAVKQNNRERIERKISARLSPLSTTVALDACWEACIDGDPERGDAILQTYADAGLLLP